MAVLVLCEGQTSYPADEQFDVLPHKVYRIPWYVMGWGVPCPPLDGCHSDRMEAYETWKYALLCSRTERHQLEACSHPIAFTTCMACVEHATRHNIVHAQHDTQDHHCIYATRKMGGEEGRGMNLVCVLVCAG